MGIGMSSCFIAFSVAPAHYFRRKRGLANGIVYAAGGLGGAVMSIAANAMIERYSIEWAFRISGIGLAVTAGPAAWLIKERTPLKSIRYL
jgi:MFS family permease